MPLIFECVGADVILRDILATAFVAECHCHSPLIIGYIRVVAVIKQGRCAKLLLILMVKTWSAARHDSIFTIWRLIIIFLSS